MVLSHAEILFGTDLRHFSFVCPMLIFCGFPYITECLALALKNLLQVIVTDTAGMRQTLDPIEAEGVAVAHETAQQADMVLSVLDCMTWQDSNSSPLSGAWIHDIDSAHNDQNVGSKHSHAVTVLNKADALTQQQLQQLQMQLQQQENRSGAGQHQQQQEMGVQQSNVQQAAQQTQLQQHADWQMQQQRPDEQQREASQQPGSSNSMSSIGSNSDQVETPGTNTSQLQSMHSMKTVVCSCKTGWNMDVMLRVLEQSVQGIMQSGQESEEALVITRYGLTIKAANSSAITYCLSRVSHCACIGKRL